MVLPGPEAQQLATYIGWLMFGVRGGIVAGVLFVLPSLFILSALTWVYLDNIEQPIMDAVLYGIGPAVTAIILFAAYRIGSKALSNNVLRVLAALTLIVVYNFPMAFPYVVLSAGLIGFVGVKISPNIFTMDSHHGAGKDSYGPALIGDGTPIPDHAKFKWSRLLAFAMVGVVIGLAVMSLLSDPVLHDMGEFFTKAAMVTFGGAYAVLPYISDGGIASGWVTTEHMKVGMALGESTPGPLIMVVAFVGFVGAWTKEIFGSEALLLAGFAGASVATLFTFLPSFLFIFLGGPGVEATRGDLRFSAPLSAITAAVVGAILNLGVAFARNTLLPDIDKIEKYDWLIFSISGVQIDLIALVITIVAFIALFRFKVGIMTVLAACMAIGLGLSMLA
jgi:chromate transporter